MGETTSELRWPNVPTCHRGEFFAVADPGWHMQDGRRVCNYCGSLHPEELLALLDEGAALGGSDWKYGWPHKFYVVARNPQADEIVQVGSQHGPGEPPEGTPIMGTRPTLQFKWYNDHLRDEGYGDGARERLIAALAAHSHIEFEFTDDGRLAYRAPHHGYQRF